jgi:hypothetical protein
VNRRAIGWGSAFVLAGAVVFAGWLPGSAGWSLGPRLGMATFLVVMGLVILAGSFAGAIRRRTEAVDSKGGCPVGATCACGHFNFKPRRACRQCGAATLYTTA